MKEKQFTDKLYTSSVFKEEYVLLTNEGNYFVEYLLNYLVISNSITEAMIFKDLVTAQKFKDMLLKECVLNTMISTFIE